ncbi:MAG: FAD-dependent oxidoreductase [Desulfarculus sp.]|nr:FAD-dependent oxidoreductase [Desulfarculus sp.]
MERVEIAIVGAGAVGTAIARELAQQGREVLVLEQNAGVSRGENQSTRNSGVIHAGLYYDPQTRPLKARLCPAGVGLLYGFCAQYGVPALNCGKLVVATSEGERPILVEYLERARVNGVPANLVTGEQARQMEPQVRAVAALHLPTSGVIDAAALVHKLYALASNAGAIFLTGTRLVGAIPRPEGLELAVTYPGGAGDCFLAGLLINCAGLYADQVARLVDPASPYQVDPVRGEAYKFYRGKRPELFLRGMNVYPTPQRVITAQGSYFTVGVHLTPTLEPGPGGQPALGPVVTVGPLNRGVDSKEDLGGEYLPAGQFHERVRGFFPGLREEDLEPFQAGIQARLVGHQDWVIEKSPREPRCLNLLGIDSPGLTACLALAREAAARL